MKNLRISLIGLCVFTSTILANQLFKMECTNVQLIGCLTFILMPLFVAFILIRIELNK